MIKKWETLNKLQTKQDVLSGKAGHMIKELYHYLSLPTLISSFDALFSSIYNLCLAYNGLESIRGTHPSMADYTGLVASH